MNRTSIDDVPAMLRGPGAPRAVLVALDDEGNPVHQPVESGSSVLNIDRDLYKHLNEHPYSDAWLAQLRDYCEARLEMRRRARDTGGFGVPEVGGSRWRLV